MKPTWDEVRSRSAVKMGSLDLSCGDCEMVFPLSGLPCRKHATPDESVLIDKHVTDAIRSLGGVDKVIKTLGSVFDPIDEAAK